MGNCRWLQPALVIFCVVAGFAGRCVAQDQSLPVSITPEQQNGVTTLAQMVQKELQKGKCTGAACQVLVVNLALPSGQTCSACILLSDSLVKTLGELPDAPNVISRASFSFFMDRERIPSQYLREQVTLVWLARQLHATRVVFGVLEPHGDTLQLKTQVLKHQSFGNNTDVSKEMRAKIPAGNLTDALSARESYHALPKRDPPPEDTENLISMSARKGLKLPHCSYMPNPQFTDGARQVKLNGTLLVEAIITTQGALIEPRISRGLPFGLNQNSLETLKTWKCEPATKNGAPVAVQIPLEVTFRMY